MLQDLYGFAIELRQLAYTMPGGAADPLSRPSDRMIHHAQQQGTPRSAGMSVDDHGCGCSR